jgi:hypothetical protein
MTQLRERWEGASLPGDYLLEKWMGGDDAAGFFETARSADGRRAVVKLVRESAADGAVRLALWERTRAVRHPNLRELLDCGRAEAGGETVVYAVFESADDTLAAALGRSPLAEAEAREVLAAVLGALACLRAKGLAHPALDPDQVVAVGDQIKLSTDALHDVPADTPYTDQVRTFWHKISPCTAARSADILAQALGADTATGPAGNAAPAETPPAAVLASDSPSAPPKGFPKWILVGAAGVVLLILGLNLRRAPETAVPPARTPSSVATAVSNASPAEETSSKPALKPTVKQAVKPARGAKAMWRVIAFTYLSRDAAARKAEQVNQGHPDYAATVFEPKDKKGWYLVALGGFMIREDAVRLQKKARSEGLARDVYIHNYVE